MTDRQDAYNPEPTFPPSKSPHPQKPRKVVLDHDILDKLEEVELRNRDRNIQNANETENALCGQLMLVATVFLTITVAVLANQDVLTSLSRLVRILIVVGLFLLATSIGSGVINYFKNILFYQRWSQLHNRNHALLRNREFSTWEEGSRQLNNYDKYRKKLKPYSDNKWLIIQITLMALSALIYMVAVIGILFNFGNRIK